MDFGKKRIHGHILVWHRGLPNYVKNWETATLPNGALDDNGAYRAVQNISNGEDRGSIWYRTIGKSR